MQQVPSIKGSVDKIPGYFIMKYCTGNIRFTFVPQQKFCCGRYFSLTKIGLEKNRRGNDS